ncbi:MAG: (Fe-S)-binding protein [Phycisphaerales bacterium]|nr:MAG: (Fe-S)-binding protein [Phycisphaerales bacterium]
MVELAQVATKTKAWACYDCGKCTATCPISRIGGAYSPRRHVLATNLRQQEEVSRNGTVYACLTCSLCDQRCPAEVGYTQLVQKLRELSFREGTEPECPHGGALQSVMRMMAKGGLQQDRLNWLTDDLKTEPEKGEVFYWTGCTMYYDAFFSEFEAASLEGTKAAIRLMNKLGVAPVVSANERCCGHDLLWNGDRKNFEALARQNVKLVAESGAELLVISCAECLRTWKVDYAPLFDGKPPRMVHITEFLVEHLPELELQPNGRRRATFQDPCRLGRHLGIYDPPRKALTAVPGIELAEMSRSGPRAMCCAGGTWSNCDRFAKQIQVGRLREARATGAEVLVTACPKCQIHFRCAMKDPNLKGEIEIEMRDVAEVVAEGLSR